MADKKIKIGDFGLAKKLACKNSFIIDTNVMIPIRWVAPEVLSLQKFTVQNDV